MQDSSSLSRLGFAEGAHVLSGGDVSTILHAHCESLAAAGVLPASFITRISRCQLVTGLQGVGIEEPIVLVHLNPYMGRRVLPAVVAAGVVVIPAE
jgi:hypothetical protein